MKLLDRLPDEKARAYAIRVLLYNITALELSPAVRSAKTSCLPS